MRTHSPGFLIAVLISGAACIAVEGRAAEPLRDPLQRIPAVRQVRIDSGGVLRWRDDGSEVALFGVNYYPPFAIDYAQLKARGLDIREVIRNDVAHFVRLGLTSIRLHCWDREISDRAGNLVPNEHLDLLDFLLAECKRNGIYALLTPIAWWGSPSGREGFSNFWPMREMTSNPEAWKAETNYLRQFVSHVNRYTGQAYKDDPVIVGFETINEPIYPPGFPDAKVVEYIDTLVGAIRSTGCRKPVFHSYFCNRLRAVGASSADGITFGWYPTGLASGRMRTDDCLRLVADFPAMRDPVLKGKVIAVYEFDAADVHWPYMYPAIARAFRGGGCQIANQFQYDALPLAASNVDWQTHYLNLCYTPGKAVSFAIAAEVFRRVARGQRFGEYPECNRFGPFRVSYEERLSELAAKDAFMYSNDTQTRPPSPSDLVRVWGCGSSPVVSYDGTGAYFLDRIRAGVWLLEVYPDAVLVADPYAGGSNEKVRIFRAEHQMCIRLADPGPEFRVRDVTPGRPAGREQRARAGRFSVAPGRYILIRGEGNPAVAIGRPFVAPSSSAAPPAVYLSAASRWLEGTPMPVRAEVAAQGVSWCRLHVRPAGNTAIRVIPLQEQHAYRWSGDIPSALLIPGELDFTVSVETSAKETWWFPGGERSTPFSPRRLPPIPVLTFGPKSRMPEVRYSGPPGKGARARIVPGREKSAPALHIEADGFGPPPSCAGVRLPVTPVDIPEGYNAVRFLVRGGPDTTAVEIGFQQKDGPAFGYNVPTGPNWAEVTVPLSALKPLWGTKAPGPDFRRLQKVSIIFGAWLFPDVAAHRHWVEVQSVELVYEPAVYRVHIQRRSDPVVLFQAGRRLPKVHGGTYQARIVPGMQPGTMAWRLAVTGFGPEPDCRSFRAPVQVDARPFRKELQRARHLLVTVRGVYEQTSALEIVLIEEDGAPWGTVIPLTTEWRTVRIPLDRLKYFAHWKPSCEGRGGPGDVCRPEQVRAVNVCFGAFLYHNSFRLPHGFDIQSVSLAP